MPNKPVRQNAKYREAQLRKRVSAQGRGAGAVDTAEREEMPTDTVRLDGAPAPEAPVMRFAPSGAAATAATAPRPAPPARRAAAGAATTAVRSARGRIAAQMHEMNLADEMQFIHDDIRRLLLLAVASFAVLIVLAFVIH